MLKQILFSFFIISSFSVLAQDNGPSINPNSQLSQDINQGKEITNYKVDENTINYTWDTSLGDEENDPVANIQEAQNKVTGIYTIETKDPEEGCAHHAHCKEFDPIGETVLDQCISIAQQVKQQTGVQGLIEFFRPSSHEKLNSGEGENGYCFKMMFSEKKVDHDMLENLLKQCHILAIAFDGYGVPNGGDDEEEDSSPNIQKAMIMGMMPSISCYSKKGIALDYKDCKNLKAAINVTFASDQALDLYTNTKSLIEQEKINKEASKMSAASQSVSNGDYSATQAMNDNQKKLVEMARQDAENQRKRAKERAAYFESKTAMFGALLSSYMTPKKMVRKCINTKGKFSNLDHKLVSVCDSSVAASDPATCPCKVLENERLFFPNQGGKGTLISYMMKNGSQAAAEELAAYMHKKRRDGIDDVQDKLADLQNDESEATFNLTALQQSCAQNPSQAGCDRLRTSTSNSPYGNYSFGGNGDVTNINEGTELSDIHGANPTLSDENNYSDLGDLQLNNPANGSKEKTNFAAANVKYTGPRGAGGGGGGGGAGGGSLPSGGARAQAPADDSQKGIDVKAGKAAYASGGSRSQYMANARNLRQKKNAQEKNPFDSLFGKKGKDSGDGTDVQNYRGATSLGNQKDSIFARISSRYDEMEGNGRLTKYE